MEELKENNAPRDRAILVGLSSPRLDRKENADEESLEELGALVETAGGFRSSSRSINTCCRA